MIIIGEAIFSLVQQRLQLFFKNMQRDIVD